MTMLDSKLTRLSIFGRVPGLVVMCILLTLVNACGSIPEKQVSKPSPQVAKNRCGPGKTPAAGQVKQTGEGQQPGDKSGVPAQNSCLPRGVIEIVENHQVDPEIRQEFQQALTMLEAENYADAIRLLKGVTGKTSKYTAPFINLGIAYARTGDLEKAEENFNKALEINSQHPVASNELGLVYRQTGRYSEARQLYESLLSLYPDFLPARKNLGVLCDIYIQDLDCALEQYKEYLKGIPDDEKVKIWVADVKSRM
jgi:TolA-binding protein